MHYLTFWELCTFIFVATVCYFTWIFSDTGQVIQLVSHLRRSRKKDSQDTKETLSIKGRFCHIWTSLQLECTFSSQASVLLFSWQYLEWWCLYHLQFFIQCSRVYQSSGHMVIFSQSFWHFSGKGGYNTFLCIHSLHLLVGILEYFIKW